MSQRPEQVKLKRQVMKLLTQIAEAGEPCPRNREIAAHCNTTVREIIILFGHLRRFRLIGFEMRDHNRRLFIPHVGWTDWSKPLDTSIFNAANGPTLREEPRPKYDAELIEAAMKGRRFEDHATPAWRRSYPQSAPLNYSVTGCTALECAI